MKSREEIAETLSSLREKLAAEYHIRSLGLFGSVARGDASEQSDIDILVEFDTPIGMLRFCELEEFLSKTLDHKIDLVSRNALKPSIGESVLREVMTV